MADEELQPFDPSMKKKKKKKKTGFDPDALDAGDSAPAPENESSEPVNVESNTASEQPAEKAEDDGFSLDFGMKKKKKKKKPMDMDEMKEALPNTDDVAEEETAEDGGANTEITDDFSTDISFLNKRKKKKKKTTDNDAGEDEVDSIDPKKLGKSPWIQSDRDYTYDELLVRVFDIIREKNPEMMTGEKKRIVMKPPQVLRAGARRTSFANFAEISRMMHRQSKHVLAFLLAELGTSGSVDGNNQLIIRGRFNQKQIEMVLRRYIKEYVTCHTCKSPDTLLQKEERLFFLQCETCGSRCSVASIKSGFQAVTGRRAAMRANAQ